MRYNLMQLAWKLFKNWSKYAKPNFSYASKQLGVLSTFVHKVIRNRCAKGVKLIRRIDRILSWCIFFFFVKIQPTYLSVTFFSIISTLLFRMLSKIKVLCSSSLFSETCSSFFLVLCMKLQVYILLKGFICYECLIAVTTR